MQWEGVFGRELRVGKDLVPRVLRLNLLNVRMCRWRAGRGGWENQVGGEDAGCQKERLEAGLERFLKIGRNNLGSILEENTSTQS